MDSNQQAAVGFVAFAATYIRKGMPRYPQGERTLAIVGAPGSGKAYTVNKIASMLQAKKCRYVISSDNAQDAENLGGKTIYSQFRISKSTAPEWNNAPAIVKAQSNPHVPTFCHELRVAKFWIFYGGFTEEMLQCMDNVARLVRKSSHPFGGLFMVFVADFLTTFDFAPSFQAWASLGAPPHRTIKLTTPHKHSNDPPLVELLNRLRYNTPLTKGDREVLLRMSSGTRQGLILRNTRMARDALNKRRLQALPGDCVDFIAKDSHSDVSNFIQDVPALISLKVGALVIITVNTYAPAVCSGMFGTIEGFVDTSKVTVSFQTKAGPVIKVVGRNSFEEKDLASNIVYKRSQIPLCLAWATSPSRASHSLNLDSQAITIDHCAGDHAYSWSYQCLSVARSTANVVLSDLNAFNGGRIDQTRIEWEQRIGAAARPALERPAAKPRSKRPCLGHGQKTLQMFWTN